jgi:thiosulfate dehydrogenase (quinone) large subunit
LSYRQVYSSLSTGKVQRNCSPLRPWRQRIAVGVRVVFGCIWAINAWLVWQSAIQDTLTSYLPGAAVQRSMAWIGFWLHVVSLNPRLFAFILAAGKASIAIGLLFGILSNLTCLAGILLLLCLYATGGGSLPGASDNGVLIVYMLVFIGLFLGNAGGIFGMDRYVASMLGRWSFLAARPPSVKRSPGTFRSAHTPIPAGYPQLVLLPGRQHR